MGNLIITVGREFGSGGRQVGQALAKAYGIKCYDSEIITKVATDLGFNESIVSKLEEKPSNSALHSMVMGLSRAGNPLIGTDGGKTLSEQVCIAQFKTIKKIAQEESCVFVGRSADYILSQHDNVVSTFIHADLDYRIKNIMSQLKLDEDAAKKVISKNDKQRAGFYNYYTDRKWGMSKYYDLSVSTSKIGIDGAVKLIDEYIKLRNK